MTLYGARPAQPPARPAPIPTDPTETRRAALLAAATVVIALLAATGFLATGSGGQKPSARWMAAPGTASPVPSPPSPTVAAQTVTLSGVGDVIMGSAPGSLPPNNGRGLFDPVKRALAADLVMGNLEEPLTENTGAVKCAQPSPTSPPPGSSTSPAPSGSPAAHRGCYQFHLPPSYAKVLRDGGFGLVNLANNHTMDEGSAGLRNTRAALEAAGIQHTGAPGQVTVVTVRNVSIAVIGVAPYSYCQSLIDIAGTAALVRRAASAADLVVIQMQAGAEGADRTHVRPGMETFLGEQRGDVLAFAHAMIDAGADLVIGHGPHVMRGMQFYKGRLIAYSMGNFVGYKALNSTGNSGVGGVVRVTLRKDGTWVSGSLVATHMVNGGLPAPDPNNRAWSLVNGLSRQDFGASAAVIGSDGSISLPTG
ncbi:MAG TPA: CapA family protein [Micromonosporaceae bacterium]